MFFVWFCLSGWRACVNEELQRYVQTDNDVFSREIAEFDEKQKGILAAQQVKGHNPLSRHTCICTCMSAQYTACTTHTHTHTHTYTHTRMHTHTHTHVRTHTHTITFTHTHSHTHTHTYTHPTQYSSMTTITFLYGTGSSTIL